jgi:hypothetical protein
MPWSSGDVRFWQVKPCGFREADGVHFILRIAKLPRHPFAAAASSSCSPHLSPRGLPPFNVTRPAAASSLANQMISRPILLRNCTDASRAIGLPWPNLTASNERPASLRWLARPSSKFSKPTGSPRPKGLCIHRPRKAFVPDATAARPVLRNAQKCEQLRSPPRWVVFHQESEVHR